MTDEIECYLATLSKPGMSPATLRAARSDLFTFCRWWQSQHGQIFDLVDLVDRDIRAWKLTRQQFDGVAPATINRGLSTLRNFCRWAVSQKLLVENPTVGIEDVSTETLAPRFLPDVAVDALLRAVHNEKDFRLRLRDEAVLALLIYAGLRVQEVCDVQLRDLDLCGGTITVRSGKAGKARRVPLHPDAQHMLTRYLSEVRCQAGMPSVGSDQEREALLLGMQITVKERPFTPGIQTRIIRRRLADRGRQAAALLREKANREHDLPRAQQLRDYAQLLETVSPHMLRHSLARRMLKSGAQLPEVQRVLGHSRLSTTGIYLTPSEDDLRTAIWRSGI